METTLGVNIPRDNDEGLTWGSGCENEKERMDLEIRRMDLPTNWL